VSNSQAFQWLSQLRHCWNEELQQCYVNICDAQFLYSYEYVGNTSRLVITPLTDRIAYKYSLQYVYFVHPKSIGNIYKGLAQTGAWGCFDEFNRIPVDVLSVVAVQVKTIQDAIRSKKETYVTSWIDRRERQTERAHLMILFEKYVPRCLEQMKNTFKTITPIPENSMVQAVVVHTAETVRLSYFLNLLLERRQPVMLVGNAGVGKTALVRNKLDALSESYTISKVSFNYYTTSLMLQAVSFFVEILERPLEKRAGRTYSPVGNRRLVYFIDDMNIPAVDSYGTVQPHALIRQHLDYGHCCRISRILEAPRSHGLLVGVGGSGKQSLTRLAAYMSSVEVFQITLRKGYSTQDLKKKYLAHALVLRSAGRCLQVVLCTSPVGSALRVRARQFPALINSTTIDWFHPWTTEALQSVSYRFILEIDGIEVDDLKAKLASQETELTLKNENIGALLTKIGLQTEKVSKKREAADVEAKKVIICCNDYFAQVALMQAEIAVKRKDSAVMVLLAPHGRVPKDRSWKAARAFMGKAERERWSQTIVQYEKQQKTLCGDVLLTSAFISYLGYFTSQYRVELFNNSWVPFLQSQKVSVALTDGLDPILMLTDDATVAAWHNQGLPSDRMSTENAAILTTSERWPLIFDPQQQAIKWIRNRLGPELRVVQLGQKG
ncbi:hypothetical protein XENOCAPTIV_022255, partial [Xenoophorus captivus]